MSAPKVTPLNAGYDQNLLAVTPEVSKAARQGGYNVDLLNDDGLPQQQHNATRSNTDLEHGAYQGQPVYAKEAYAPMMPQRKVPWWRTRIGIITLIIAGIVIIGAVVGGAVGGSAAKGKDNTQLEQDKNPPKSTSILAPSGATDKNGPSTRETSSRTGDPPAPTSQNTSPGNDGRPDQNTQGTAPVENGQPAGAPPTDPSQPPSGQPNGPGNNGGGGGDVVIAVITN